jgi:hypothetical protein
MRNVVKLCAAFAAINLVVVAIAGEAEARRRHGWGGYGRGHHSHHRPHRRSLVRSNVDEAQTAPDPINAPTTVPEAPKPAIRMIRPIVNGKLALPWAGPPPSWAGDLHISRLSEARSAPR